MTAGPDPWVAVARVVGLSLAYVSERHVTGATFGGLRREMARATTPPGADGAAPWLHGTRHDVAIVVRPIVLQQPGAARQKAPTHLAAIAEIDPPLFAGLRVSSRDLVAFHGVAHRPLLSGHPALDARFITAAFDLQRVRELFLPRGVPDGLGIALARAALSASIMVKDSSVEAIAEGVEPAGDRIDALVDSAASLAREISRRAAGLTQSAKEIEARSAWHRLALSLGLSIDPLRWHVFGSLGDVQVSAMLEGSPPAVFTTLRARFRSRLACPLFLRSGFGKGAANKTGHAELDRLLVLDSPDPTQARAILGVPEVRALIATEAGAANLMLDDCEIVLGRGGFATTREIRERLQALVAIVDAMTPPLPVAGPFR